ncbi:MAG: hypothetical protein K6T88_13495, partial [Bacillus sp. (in: Bacteria)]|nr:hypothetical protein [Bacillus sp. (in: firmicutes)]
MNKVVNGICFCPKLTLKNQTIIKPHTRKKTNKQRKKKKNKKKKKIKKKKNKNNKIKKIFLK